MRAAGDDPDGVRLRGLIVVLWRAGLRISEALALAESDLDRVRGAIQVRHGKGGRRREVGMDRWAWEQLDPWLNLRAGLPIGALFCVLRGPTRGRPCSAAGIRVQLRNAAITAGVRRRLAPHQYADLRVMPTKRRGMPQIADSAVEEVGITHRRSRTGSMTDTTEQRGRQRRSFLRVRRALSAPQRHVWQRFRGWVCQAARAMRGYVHTSFLAPVCRKT
jgi:hypothetical protein